MSGEPPRNTSVSTVFSASNTLSCARYSMRRPFCVTRVPASTGMSPATALRNVLLPVPFTPTMPTLSPAARLRSTPEKSSFSP